MSSECVSAHSRFVRAPQPSHAWAVLPIAACCVVPAPSRQDRQADCQQPPPWHPCLHLFALSGAVHKLLRKGQEQGHPRLRLHDTLMLAGTRARYKHARHDDMRAPTATHTRIWPATRDALVIGLDGPSGLKGVALQVWISVMAAAQMTMCSLDGNKVEWCAAFIFFQCLHRPLA